MESYVIFEDFDEEVPNLDWTITKLPFRTYSSGSIEYASQTDIPPVDCDSICSDLSTAPSDEDDFAGFREFLALHEDRANFGQVVDFQSFESMDLHVPQQLAEDGPLTSGSGSASEGAGPADPVCDETRHQ